MDPDKTKIAALKNIRDRNDSSKNGANFNDYVKTFSVDALPFGDQVGGLAGGAGASAGTFLGELERGESLGDAASRGLSSFSEGRDIALKGIDESRNKLPAAAQGASLAMGMMMPVGIGKIGKAANVVDKAGDLSKASKFGNIIDKTTKSSGGFGKIRTALGRGEDAADLFNKAKLGKQLEGAAEITGKAADAFKSKIFSKMPDLEPAQVQQLMEEAAKRGLY